MASLDPDDPRLTAYALGEADEADRRAVETYLAESEEGRAAIEQTRAMASAVAAEYACEKDAYLAARPEGGLPSNVVAFSSGPKHRWRHAAVLTLKIAALVAVMAPIIFLTVRSSHRPGGVSSIASAPPGAPAPAPIPGIVASEPTSKDKAETPQDQDRAALKQATVTDRSLLESAASAPPSGNSIDSQLAMKRADDADKVAETSAGGRAAGTFSMDAAPPPSVDGTHKPAPSAGAPADRSATAPAKPSPLEERIPRSVVRIRSAGGAFFGGVLVSTDGGVLAAPALPATSLVQPCTLFLPDQRQQTAVAKAVGTGTGWYLFFVDRKELPAAPLANEVSTNDSSLVIAAVDQRSGTLTFPRVTARDADSFGSAARRKMEQSQQAAANAAFAFNPSGELLVLDPAEQEAQMASQAKTRNNSEESRSGRFRPFTSAERAMLQQAAKRNGK